MKDPIESMLKRPIATAIVVAVALGGIKKVIKEFRALCEACKF